MQPPGSMLQSEGYGPLHPRDLNLLRAFFRLSLSAFLSSFYQYFMSSSNWGFRTFDPSSALAHLQDCYKFISAVLRGRNDGGESIGAIRMLPSPLSTHLISRICFPGPPEEWVTIYLHLNAFTSITAISRMHNENILRESFGAFNNFLRGKSLSLQDKDRLLHFLPLSFVTRAQENICPDIRW